MKKTNLLLSVIIILLAIVVAVLMYSKTRYSFTVDTSAVFVLDNQTGQLYMLSFENAKENKQEKWLRLNPTKKGHFFDCK